MNANAPREKQPARAKQVAKPAPQATADDGELDVELVRDLEAANQGDEVRGGQSITCCGPVCSYVTILSK